MGEPGSPIPPPAGRRGRSPCAGGWGNRVSPSPIRWGGWEGYALKQGDGGTRFPHPPARCEHRWQGSAPLPASPRRGEEPDSRPQRGRAGEGVGTVPAEMRRGRDARAPSPVDDSRCEHVPTIPELTPARLRGIVNAMITQTDHAPVAPRPGSYPGGPHPGARRRRPSRLLARGLFASPGGSMVRAHATIGRLSLP